MFSGASVGSLSLASVIICSVPTSFNSSIMVSLFSNICPTILSVAGVGDCSLSIPCSSAVFSLLSLLISFLTSSLI